VRISKGLVGALFAFAVAIALLAAWTLSSGIIESGDPACRGHARCFSGPVVAIVDGDTLDVGEERVRLALVDTPEIGEAGYGAAKAFTASLCPVGSNALVDEDDGQNEGSYGRIVARVFCRSANLNAELVGAGHATIVTQFCSVSEFADEPWAVGC
jgi:endonuclease YncB( thermonuclease family)